ncbi:MAG: NTP transferase domain-containing protein [Cyanobacteria bacterium REEB67]|nr:NTP transferase domain-containing protein [Cyanobacteria bacterium REEB67]
MHVIIPLSGKGERFVNAGYEQPKPLIIVDGKPMIEHVVSMFDANDRFTFICNQEHAQNSDLLSELKRIAPAASIVVIPSHKYGPVFAVQQCFDCIDDQKEVIVNYCDFYSYWDYPDFLEQCHSRGAAGAIAAYRGFHPHMLGSDNYAFIKEKDQWLIAIQEKKPFTENKMAEYASNGTYYFASGALVKRYFRELIDRKESVNGEYYVSMVYNLMVEDKLPVLVYEVPYMLQWGTPGDLEEYQKWSNYFACLAQEVQSRATAVVPVDLLLMPMAGQGARFRAVGYDLPKPLIDVSGKAMVVQASLSLPPAKRHVFVVQKELLANSELEAVLRSQFENLDIVSLDGLTEGQAITCLEGLLGALPPVDPGNNLLIGACDNGMLFDAGKWATLIEDQSIDVAAFSFRHHTSSKRNPQMYGWLKVANDSSLFPTVTAVSVKKAISATPAEDHAIVGAFFFRKTAYFFEALRILQERDIRVNGEFYVDSLIDILVQLKRHCVAFEVEEYICFGTPNDLLTYNYWQAFFHRCNWHAYSIEQDPQANQDHPDLLERLGKRQVAS